MKKLAYLDLETTGLLSWVHGITQIGLILEVDHETVEEVVLNITPPPNKTIEDLALEVQGIKREDLKDPSRLKYPTAFGELTGILDMYVDPMNRKDKFQLIGYNITKFDEPFLRQFFKDNSNNYFGSYFHFPTFDVMTLVAMFFEQQGVYRTAEAPDVTLNTAAKYFNVTERSGNKHDALEDVRITKELFEGFEIKFANMINEGGNND